MQVSNRYSMPPVRTNRGFTAEAGCGIALWPALRSPVALAVAGFHDSTSQPGCYPHPHDILIHTKPNDETMDVFAACLSYPSPCVSASPCKPCGVQISPAGVAPNPGLILHARKRSANNAFTGNETCAP